ncbi:hypothetical protein CB1_001512020 [Camelus ferus]|nr:hypothetical protein CB1_001512020 [Camelus ferus]
MGVQGAENSAVASRSHSAAGATGSPSSCATHFIISASDSRAGSFHSASSLATCFLVTHESQRPVLLRPVNWNISRVVHNPDCPKLCIRLHNIQLFPFHLGKQHKNECTGSWVTLGCSGKPIKTSPVWPLHARAAIDNMPSAASLLCQDSSEILERVGVNETEASYLFWALESSLLPGLSLLGTEGRSALDPLLPPHHTEDSGVTDATV